MYTKDGFHKALEQKLGDDAYLLLANGGHKKLTDLLTAASITADGNNTKLSITVGGTTKTGSVTVPYASNADKVDGIHANGLLTAASLGASGNSTTISVTVGGTTKTGSVTVPYATNSTSTEYLNNYSTSDPAASKQDLKVKWFASIGSTVGGSAGYAGNNYGFPCSNNANGILWLGTHSGNYGGQLGISSNGSIYYRFISAGSFPTTANGGSWVRLVTSSNYTDYTVTKTGSGASGTWGINVTGSAGSVAWGNVSSKPATATRWPTWAEVTSKPSSTGSGTQPVYWNGSTFVACTTYANASVNYATSAGNADTVDGHHQDHLLPYRYTYGAQTNSGNTDWYVRIQTANYISEDCTIYVRGTGNNTSSDFVLHVLCRDNRFWGWETSYNGVRISGIAKETGAPEIIYLRMPSSTTSITFKSTHSLTIDKADYSSKSYMSLGEGLFANYIYGKIQNADYATSAGSVAWGNVTGKPTTLSGYGITDGLYSIQVSSAQDNVTWAKGTAKTNRRAFIYNTSGTEYSYLFGFSSSNTSSGDVNYGAVLKMGYNDAYLRILRVYQGSWKTTDWEKISAGYADSAGSVAWSNVTGKPSSYTPSSGSSYYVQKLAWWNYDDSHNVNSLMSGTTFAYTSHNAPTNGTIVAFSCTNNGYPLQLQGQYSGENLYFRNYNGDNGTWKTWRTIIHSGNIGSQSVSYATSAGNADTVDSLHGSNLVRFFLSPMTSGAPADSAKSWFTGTMPSASGAIVYNVPGAEKTIIAGKSSGAHGHMLQLNYDDTYLRILRYYGGNWKSTDWEKISAGYADSAGSASSASNADTVDSYHANRFAFTYNSANYTNSSSVSVNDLVTNGVSNASHGMIYPATDNPVGSANWVHVWSQQWTIGTTSSWVSQIALGVQQGTGMWYRTTSGNIVGKGWIRVLDSSNYISYMPRSLPANGGNADTVDSYHANRFAFTYCSANYGASSSVTVNDLVTNGVSNASHGMIYAATDNPVGSANWVHVWSQQWTIGTTSSWVSQIALGVQQGTGMWYRTYSGNIVGRGWTRVLDSSNYTSYAISRSGDDVTGHYTFRGRVFGYNYNNQGNNAAAFMWDKPGSYYTGMGPNGVTNQIHFGPCNADGTWVSGFSQQWEFQGNVYATNFYTSSDRIKKTNIESIASIVPIRKFNWKQDGSLSYGFIAQELVELGHKELVHGTEGNMTVNYDAALSLSMAKLSNYVERLENTVKELQQEIKILKGEA